MEKLQRLAEFSLVKKYVRFSGQLIKRYQAFLGQGVPPGQNGKHFVTLQQSRRQAFGGLRIKKSEVHASLPYPAVYIRVFSLLQVKMHRRVLFPEFLHQRRQPVGGNARQSAYPYEPAGKSPHLVSFFHQLSVGVVYVFDIRQKFLSVGGKLYATL